MENECVSNRSAKKKRISVDRFLFLALNPPPPPPPLFSSTSSSSTPWLLPRNRRAYSLRSPSLVVISRFSLVYSLAQRLSRLDKDTTMAMRASWRKKWREKRNETNESCLRHDFLEPASMHGLTDNREARRPRGDNAKIRPSLGTPGKDDDEPATKVSRPREKRATWTFFFLFFQGIIVVRLIFGFYFVLFPSSELVPRCILYSLQLLVRFCNFLLAYRGSFVFVKKVFFEVLCQDT